MREKKYLEKCTRVKNYLKNDTADIEVHEKSKAMQVNSQKPCNHGYQPRGHGKTKEK